MHISWKDLKKYFLFSIFFLWLIIFAHLFYVYVEKQSQPQAVKWWVLLEWVITNKIINPYPYVANNYYSKYVQSLLFRSCLNDLWKDDLCSISTKDRKTFYVTMTWNNYWKDWRKITIDDVLFTYNQVIKNNSLQLKYPIPNTLESVKKVDDKTLKVTFQYTTVNNWSFFKNPILPKHILEWATKDYYVLDLSKDLVNSTCVNIDPKSDFKNKIILDYTKCPDYYINKYQFDLAKNLNQFQKYLTGSTQIDIYNWYENLDPNKFWKFDIKLKNRYALFWNVLKQKNPKIKSYLSNYILEQLKKDISLSNRLAFNWYWLFVLPKNQIGSWEFKKILTQSLLEQAKNNFESNLIKINWNIFKYKTWENKAFVKKIKDYLYIHWQLLTWYDKIWIIANSWNEYILKTYKTKSKEFKYVVSPKFWNIHIWKNTYEIIWHNKNWKINIDTITIYYQKIIYPKFNVNAPDFTIVYLDKWLTSLIWDKTTEILKNIYPWKVIAEKISKEKYDSILSWKNYDLVIWSINFAWKDISYMFQTKNPIMNPSNFANQNFASLINQDLLAPINLKKKIFAQLNEIYQQYIPVVFIWNEKMGLFVQKKYNIPNLDYSYFTNRKKMLKNIVITKIKKPALKNTSLKWFIDFLKNNLKK